MAEEKKKAGRPKKKAEPKAKPVVVPEIEKTEDEIKTFAIGKTYTVNVKTRLNVRTGVGKDNDIIRQLDNGDKIEVLEISDGWARIGKSEWVMLDYLK